MAPLVCVISFLPNITQLVKENLPPGLVSDVINIPIDDIQSHQTELNQAEIILSDPTYGEHWINGLPNLKFVQGAFTGVDRAMKSYNPAHGKPTFLLSRLGGLFGPPMADYVIAQIIGYERCFREIYKAQEQCSWTREFQKHIWFHCREVTDLTIGILGLGDIGRTVAKVCKFHGMKVIGFVNSIPQEKSLDVDEYKTSDELDEVLSSADYVCNLLPSTAQTRGLLDSDTFKACAAKRSVFMNVGRGDVCTEQSIINALENNWIRAAILDVVPTEPLPVSSALWSHKNVIITPHISANATPKMLATYYSENIQRYVKKEPIKYLVDWDKGY